MGGFKDHFSGHAAKYAQFRPHYPSGLFACLASLVSSRELAWDAATGNGQGALDLAPYFERVVGSDASSAQIKNAMPHPKVTYRVEPAEATKFEPQSVDLISVAQALHWLDLPKFYAEVKRVLKPEGVIAVWCYNLFRAAPDIDNIVLHFYRDLVGPHWPPERAHIETGYRHLEFPFAEINAPLFVMEVEWDMHELLGYLGTWSATQRYIKAEGHDPRRHIVGRLESVWGSPQAKRRIQWPLHLRAGKIT
ncbi:MAG TPA: class I SAM-dependent methyltransferase [Burkholderiales bacterium]|nr:class I SAM-dependent methyltransferase [Burkholderiales bacterium]